MNKCLHGSNQFTCPACTALNIAPGIQKFVTKDSGERQQFETGMVRDVQTNKPRYDLIGSGWELIKRWAELMGRGAAKYGEFNFEKASTQAELDRFRASALRHMIQWFHGETDEDHASATCFNLAGAEMVKKKLQGINKNVSNMSPK
jgi:hypothetical protein